jgi:hypothetical protein
LGDGAIDDQETELVVVEVELAITASSRDDGIAAGIAGEVEFELLGEGEEALFGGEVTLGGRLS